MARLRAKSGLYDRGIIAQASAPGSGYQGQLWFNNATGVLYQYMHDGASNFWLDISSGGIGTSASRGVDFVGDTDPHLETSTTGAGLAVGSVYYNRETDRYFVCTNSGTNANVWVGRYAGIGGIETTYKSGSDFYRVHTFLNSGTFHMDGTTTCDFLVVAGGGAGGGDASAGAGAGGLRSSIASTGGGGSVESPLSITAGNHAITVGAGAVALSGDTHGDQGGSSSIGALKSCTGGGGSPGHAYAHAPAKSNGGSGAGAFGTQTSNANTVGTRVAGEGFVGGASPGSYQAGGGGGGAGAVGAAATSSAAAGNGGAGVTNTIRDGSTAVQYAGGGGGSKISGGTAGTASHGGGAGTISGNGSSGVANTGGGGGGSANGSKGGNGGSGIVIIRYQLNA